MRRATKWGLSGLALVVMAGVTSGVMLWNTTRPGEPLAFEPVVTEPATDAELTTAASRRIFFGHQSVGKNVLDGVPGAYAARGADAPVVVDLGDGSRLPDADAPVIAHAYLGENRYPLLKLRDFDARLRGGLGDQVDVAAMKLCYLDITADTDVEALFEEYRRTLADLAQAYPEVTFVHVTTPVRTEPMDLKWLAKELIGRPNDNAARERYNALMREEYGDDLLFDLAAVEATAPGGALTMVPHDGRQHLALALENASDSGHLNATGSLAAATRFLGLLARPEPVG